MGDPLRRGRHRLDYCCLQNSLLTPPPNLMKTKSINEDPEDEPCPKCGADWPPEEEKEDTQP